MKCSTIEKNTIEKLEYKRNDLINFFEEYNNCNHHKYINFQEKEKRDLFHITLRPRINSSSLSIQNSVSNSQDTEFKNKIGFGFGVEAEYILPFNKNKWSISIEPTYQSFKAEQTTDGNNFHPGIITAKVDYSSVEVPVSLRHYFFLNNNSKIFLNASYIFDLNLNSTLEFIREDGSMLNALSIDTRGNFAIGIGFKQNDKYSVELRYLTNREVLGSYSLWNSEYKTVSFILGYSLF